MFLSDILSRKNRKGVLKLRASSPTPGTKTARGGARLRRGAVFAAMGRERFCGHLASTQGRKIRVEKNLALTKVKFVLNRVPLPTQKKNRTEDLDLVCGLEITLPYFLKQQVLASVVRPRIAEH